MIGLEVGGKPGTLVWVADTSGRNGIETLCARNVRVKICALNRVFESLE